MQVLVLFASLVGLIGSTTLLHPTGLFGIRLEILWTGSAHCAAMLAIQFGAAWIFGNFVNQTRHLAFFAIGAVCAGGGSYLVSEATVGLLGSIDLITKCVPDRCLAAPPHIMPTPHPPVAVSPSRDTSRSASSPHDSLRPRRSLCLVVGTTHRSPPRVRALSALARPVLPQVHFHRHDH